MRTEYMLKNVWRIVNWFFILGIICGGFFLLLSIRPVYKVIEPQEASLQRSIVELTSTDYQGKLSGSEGNNTLISYIESELSNMGIEPAGENGSYRQSFDVLVPDVDSYAEFNIYAGSGDVVESLILYEDYNVLSYLNGGAIDFDGSIVLLGENLFRVDPLYIKDNVVVVEANRLQPDWIQYVIDMGGKGVLCCTDTRLVEKADSIEHQKSTQVFGKTGPSILVGYLSGASYATLKELIIDDENNKKNKIKGVIERARIKVDMKFPIVKSASVVGVIQGSDNNGRILLLSANLDGLGYGQGEQVFPGAIQNSSGVAGLLEIARILSSQPSQPYESIVFAFWSGQHQNLAGSSYYLSHPLFPLEKTTHIHLDSLGLESLEGVLLQSDSLISSILKEKILNYAMDNERLALKAGPSNPISSQFVDKNIPSVTLSDARAETYPENTYYDTADLVHVEFIKNAVFVVLDYIARESYTLPMFDYLTREEKIGLIVLGLGGLFSLMLEQWFRRYPTYRIMGISVERLYFKLPVRFLKTFYTLIFPYLCVIGMLSFLVNIKQTTDIQRINGVLTSNFSLYLTLKQTVVYLRTLISFDTFQIKAIGSIFEIIKESSLLSLKLIGASLSIAVVAGLIRGIIESYRSKPINLRSFGTLVLFSVPDVFIVLLGLIAYTYIYKKYPIIENYPLIKDFILPVLTLSIIPTIYVSRVTFVAVHEELGKEYVRASKALGYSRIKLFSLELLPAIVFKLIDTLPTIMTLILSNMIIVEYLFNYNGIGYFLLYLYKKQDITRFVPLAVTLGLMYVVFTLGIQGLARLLNPTQKEVRHEKA